MSNPTPPEYVVTYPNADGETITRGPVSAREALAIADTVTPDLPEWAAGVSFFIAGDFDGALDIVRDDVVTAAALETPAPIVETFTTADGAAAVRYLTDDVEQGIAAGSELLISAASGYAHTVPIAPEHDHRAEPHSRRANECRICKLPIVAAYTYGDVFTLPAIPGVTWRVFDRRSVDKAGSATETRAEVRPVRAEDPENKQIRDIVTKIGRTERKGVYVGLAMRADYDRATDSYPNPPRLRAWASCDGMSASLTDAQRKLVDDAMDAQSFDLPPLTPGEIVEQLASSAESAGNAAAHRVWENLPDRYSYTSDTRATVRAALTEQAREAIAEAATAAFAASVRKTLRDY